MCVYVCVNRHFIVISWGGSCQNRTLCDTVLKFGMAIRPVGSEQTILRLLLIAYSSVIPSVLCFWIHIIHFGGILRVLRRGVVVSGVRQWTKLTHVGPGYNWDGWPSSGGYTTSGCNQPTRSTQPCIPPGSLNRVPASAGVKAGISPLPGGR